jgi:hypothetical protein
MSYPCDYCGRKFTHPNSKWRHKKTCCKRPQKKIKVPIRPKQPQQPVYNDNIKMILDILQRQQQQLDRLTNEPKIVSNNITNHINFNGINPVSSDIFRSLIDKFGKEQALSMLTSQDLTKTVINVMKKLYFDGDPSQFPIASRPDKHFRYLDDENNLVNDFGGQMTQQFVTNKINNAMIFAVNDVIKDSMSGKDVDLQYDLRKLQNNLDPSTAKSSEIIEALFTFALNIHHPFFIQSWQQERVLNQSTSETKLLL